MNQEAVAALVNEFKHAKSFDEVFTAWYKNRPVLKGSTVIYSFDDIGSSSPLKPVSGVIERGQFHIRSIFSNKNVYYFNDEIMRNVLQKTGRSFPACRSHTSIPR